MKRATLLERFRFSYSYALLDYSLQFLKSRVRRTDVQLHAGMPNAKIGGH